MGSVAKGKFFGLAAAAVSATPVFFYLNLNRVVFGAFMGTIAIGLVFGFTASAVPFGSGCFFNDNWILWKFHEMILSELRSFIV